MKAEELTREATELRQRADKLEREARDLQHAEMLRAQAHELKTQAEELEAPILAARRACEEPAPVLVIEVGAPPEAEAEASPAASTPEAIQAPPTLRRRGIGPVLH